MSFVKKAVKKVFSVVKKVVKSKVFKWVAIAAAVFFTAGVAAGGFAAFAGVNSVGAFFTAVGQTMATGAASMASALGFKGAAAGLAQHGGAAAIQAGLTSTATSATGAALTANAAAGTITSVAEAGTMAGELASIGGKGAMALSSKGMALAQGTALAESAAGAAQLMSGVPGMSGTTTQLGQVAGGLTSSGASAGVSANVWRGAQVGLSAASMYYARKGDKKGPTFVAGGLSHGGSSTLGPQPYFVVGGTKGKMSTDPNKAPQAPATQQATLAGELARQETPTNEKPQYSAPAIGGVLEVAEPVYAKREEEPKVTGDVDAEPSMGIRGLAQAEAPTTQVGQQDMLRPSNILSPAKERSLEDRIFGGVLSGA